MPQFTESSLVYSVVLCLLLALLLGPQVSFAGHGTESGRSGSSKAAFQAVGESNGKDFGRSLRLDLLAFASGFGPTRNSDTEHISLLPLAVSLL